MIKVMFSEYFAFFEVHCVLRVTAFLKHPPLKRFTVIARLRLFIVYSSIAKNAKGRNDRKGTTNGIK